MEVSSFGPSKCLLFGDYMSRLRANTDKNIIYTTLYVSLPLSISHDDALGFFSTISVGDWSQEEGGGH